MNWVKGIFLAVIIAILVAAIIALPVMLLWNYVVPEVFGLKEINFWQALAISLLSSLLIQSSSNSKD